MLYEKFFKWLIGIDYAKLLAYGIGYAYVAIMYPAYMVYKNKDTKKAQTDSSSYKSCCGYETYGYYEA